MDNLHQPQPMTSCHMPERRGSGSGRIVRTRREDHSIALPGLRTRVAGGRAYPFGFARRAFRAVSDGDFGVYLNEAEEGRVITALPSWDS